MFEQIVHEQFYDYVVQDRLDDEFDKSVLHKPLFPVNMRLFKSSIYYRHRIEDVVRYMEVMLTTQFDGYTQARGMSGANLGMPWNIIGVRYSPRPNNRFSDYCKFFLNPVITDRSPKVETVLSNCGSIRLAEPIPVKRNVWIDLSYYDLQGEHQTGRFYRSDGGFTIQHEVEHNLGILITDDRNEKQAE